MLKVNLPLCVKWQWHGDKGWQDYDATLSNKLEQAFQANLKKIPVDNQRHVDLNFSNEREIKSHFTNMDQENHLVGLQRRNDDPNKRRPVRRYIQKVLDKEVAILLGLPDKTEQHYKQRIQEHGGSVVEKVTNKVTMVFCEPEEVEDYEEAVEKAQELKIPVYKESFLNKILSNGGIPTHSDSYKIVYKKPKKRELEPTVEEESKWTGICNYQRKGESKKKDHPFTLQIKSVKKGSFKGTIQWLLANVTRPFKATLSGKKLSLKEKKGDDEDDDDLEECLTLEGQFKTETTVEGKAFDSSKSTEGEDLEEGIPPNEGTFTLELTENKSSKKKRKLNKEEDLEEGMGEEGMGEDLEEGNGKPTSTSKNSSTKKSTTSSSSSDEEGSSSTTIKSSSSSSPSSKTLKENSKYIGCCSQEGTCFPMIMEIQKKKKSSSSNKSKYEGIIRWVTLCAVTKFKSSLSGNQFSFEEYEATKGKDQVEIPTKYRGTIRNENEIVGYTLDGGKETETKFTLGLVNDD